MGLIKEYADREVQTETDIVPSPYADPAVVLAAPPVSRYGLVQEAHLELSTPGPNGADIVQKSPISPILSPLVSRRFPKRRPTRYSGDIVNRRIVSMPENKSETLSVLSDGSCKRVVSMPDRIRSPLEPSVELSQPSSTTADDSFGLYGEHDERVRAFPVPSDIPQTPSPPSSPESLLIIATGTQLPDGFLRRKYSPEPLVEEDEDWITWANSPPRPIPALHGPLSLPYARCPSGAEGTIIEEPDSVAQMIWGLGPDDQPHNQIRATEGISSHVETIHNALLHGSGQAPPRMHKKKFSMQQVPKSSRTHVSALAKPVIARTQRQVHDDKRSSMTQVSSDNETQQDPVSGLLWNERQSTPANIEILDNLANDSDVFPFDDNCILEWQLARLRHTLRTSLSNMDSYSTYPEPLEPVVSTTATTRFPHSYPRIFVEPRPNESVNSTTRQSPIELAQQYRQQQLYRQALQKQKLQLQNILPTPPNSSSPQWSSQFSPYLTYCSTFSPELVGSIEHPASIPSQYRPANVSQHLRSVYDRHDHDAVNDFDTNTLIPSVKTPRIVPNVNSAASSRQNLSSSSTLAKYIKQLQALSPISQFSPLQSVPSSNDPLLSLPSTNESAPGAFQIVHRSPGIPTPPSPESPQALSRRTSRYSTRTMLSTRPMQRRLSSVPEEDSALLSSTTTSKLQRQVHLETPADVTRKIDIPNLPESQNNLGGTPPIAFFETSPVKVRLPVNKEYNIQEQANGRHEQNKGYQHGNRKRHRHKKLKESSTNERVPTRGHVGEEARL